MNQVSRISNLPIPCGLQDFRKDINQVSPLHIIVSNFSDKYLLCKDLYLVNGTKFKNIGQTYVIPPESCTTLARFNYTQGASEMEGCLKLEVQQPIVTPLPQGVQPPTPQYVFILFKNTNGMQTTFVKIKGDDTAADAYAAFNSQLTVLSQNSSGAFHIDGFCYNHITDVQFDFRP